MMARTHLLIGFLTAIIASKLLPTGNIYIFFIFVLLGALMPDIDSPTSKAGQKLGFISKFIEAIFGHRGLFHTLWAALLMPGIFWYFINRTYGAALFIGYMSHLVADGFTIKGINFTHPFLDLRMNGFIETGKTSETVLFFMLIFAIAWSYLF